ncbi:MAG TPA: hypothetical protein PLO73_11085 [Spirochaetota bacterium]|nr:hypothetical protein [Spirochaetota bacterium]
MNKIIRSQTFRISFLFVCFFYIVHLFILPNNVYCTYLGVGAQYSYSYLNYKILKDDFNNFDEYEYLEFYNDLSQVGIKNNAKTRSKDYGLCVIVDDGNDFEELGLIQLRLEYNYFTIPFNKEHNTIKGIRYGFSVDLGINVLNYESNIVYAAFTTGAYLSNGTSSINNSEYSVIEIPLGIIIGDKIAVSQNSAVVISGTYNFYNHFINNSVYLLGGLNSANGSMLNFITRRNEFIINCSYVYQFGDIFY